MKLDGVAEGSRDQTRIHCHPGKNQENPLVKKWDKNAVGKCGVAHLNKNSHSYREAEGKAGQTQQQTLALLRDLPVMGGVRNTNIRCKSSWARLESISSKLQGFLTPFSNQISFSYVYSKFYYLFVRELFTAIVMALISFYDYYHLLHHHHPRWSVPRKPSPEMLPAYTHCLPPAQCETLFTFYETHGVKITQGTDNLWPTDQIQLIACFCMA